MTEQDDNDGELKLHGQQQQQTKTAKRQQRSTLTSQHSATTHT